VRIFRSLVAVAAVAATTTALAVAPAMADPVNHHLKRVTPKAFDIVGVGSDTIEFLLDQLSVDYNTAHKTHNATHPWIYSWDATPPSDPTNLTSMIAPKAGCAKIARPDGSSAGIAAMAASPRDANPKYKCFNFARSSRSRSSTDPAKGPGGIEFVTLAKDAVTYSTAATTNAPGNLTTAQLAAIYTCTATRWNQVGGTSTATINPILPQTSSGTRSFFLTEIGGGTAVTPGNCVNSVLPEENEGVASIFKTNSANIIFPFSIGKYIAQKFHSAACKKANCSGFPACKPKKGQNAFGCDEIGHLVLRSINGTKPTTGSGVNTVINSLFTPNFQRFVFDVVPWTAATSNHIPGNEERFFASSRSPRPGWFCRKTAKKTLIDYGFLPTPLCGTAF
jgi:ABC-type phosphate transport system substrate-binding protein